MTREELIDELILANDENQILQAELDERNKTLNLADVVVRREQLVCPCTCANGLEYSNCSKNCERVDADEAN